MSKDIKELKKGRCWTFYKHKPATLSESFFDKEKRIWGKKGTSKTLKTSLYFIVLRENKGKNFVVSKHIILG